MTFVDDGRPVQEQVRDLDRDFTNVLANYATELQVFLETGKEEPDYPVYIDEFLNFLHKYRLLLDIGLPDNI